MNLKSYGTMTAIILSLMLFIPVKVQSQIIESTGTANEASSQLIYYYNLLGDDEQLIPNHIQVTNTNDTSGVWIHVKIFRSDADVLCDERNFIDFLTPNDTHVYALEAPNFPKNVGEAEDIPGESTAITLEGTEGFVVITPVVSEADLSAISFQHLIGSTNNRLNTLTSFETGIGFSFNAMGRAAVDFATGDIVPDGTPLDGVTNGFVVLQPDELIFSFEAEENSFADIIGITFRDVYGPPGLLGYAIEPSSVQWTPFIFDWKEAVTSCGIRLVECYTTLGLHDDIQHLSIFNFGEELLCGGASTPPQPDGSSLEDLAIGWTRIFVSGFDDFVNHLGVYTFVDPAFDAAWMNTNK